MQRSISQLGLLCCVSAALWAGVLSNASAQTVSTGHATTNGVCDDCMECSVLSTGGARASLGSRRGRTSCRDPEYGQPDLFRNYWVGPNCGSAAAQLYPAPRPTPEYVGQVYYTYEPFMPHEMLYAHRRSYHRYYNEGRGLTRAKARWYTPASSVAAQSVMSFLNFAR